MNQKPAIQKFVLQALACLLPLFKVGNISQAQVEPYCFMDRFKKIQYIAGFKRVSSAEYYRQANLENLKDLVVKYHPLRQPESEQKLLNL